MFKNAQVQFFQLDITITACRREIILAGSDYYKNSRQRVLVYTSSKGKNGRTTQIRACNNLQTIISANRVNLSIYIGLQLDIHKQCHRKICLSAFSICTMFRKSDGCVTYAMLVKHFTVYTKVTYSTNELSKISIIPINIESVYFNNTTKVTL